MELPRECIICSTKESHGYKIKKGNVICATCSPIKAINFHSIKFNQKIRSAAEAHKKDLIQPWKGDKINDQFVRHYPQESKEMFRKKDIEKVKAGLPTTYKPPIIDSNGKNIDNL